MFNINVYREISGNVEQTYNKEKEKKAWFGPAIFCEQSPFQSS